MATGGETRRGAVAAALVMALGLAAGRAAATKPCPPPPTLARQRALSAWIAVGVVIVREERRSPFPNCALEDRSACAMRDDSVVTVRVERYEKGRGPAELNLVAGWCAPDPPAGPGGRFRFYGGVDLSSYATYEELPGPGGEAPQPR